VASYLILSTLTDEGRKTLKDRPERLQEVNRELVALGGRLSQQMAMFGPYDFLNVVEAPDNETASRIAVDLGSRGTVRLTTLPAIPTAGDTARSSRGSDYVVFTKLTPDGRKEVQRDPERLTQVEAAAKRAGAQITRQFRVLGEYDYVTLVRAPDNATASRIASEVSALGTVKLNVYPAIPIERFTQLLQLKAYRNEPHTWQTALWAQLVRRSSRRWVMTRHVHRFCKPFTVEGAESLRGVRGPAIIIANHTSHFDTPAVLRALPSHLRERTAVAAAADRFYRASQRSWWYSLFWNTFPIVRGGGAKALEYPKWLLDHGWSILIYPEGGRFKPGQVQRFHHGATIMAQFAKVPVIPLHLEGLHAIMPRGKRLPQPGPVRVRLGAPISLEGVASLPEGTALLENAMRDLAGIPARPAPPPAAEAAQPQPAG
jgi:1-acyl-sn-glycerol-3-phosphate acyltransferase